MNKAAKSLRDENNALEEKLSRESAEIMTDIVVYIRSASISRYDQERVRRDIGEMLLEGESRGQSAAEVIGDDYKAFCDSVMCEMRQLSRKERVMTAIQEVLPGVIVLVTTWSVLTPLARLVNGEAWYILPLSISELITAAVILFAAVFIVVYITKRVYTPKPALLIIGLALAAAIGVAGIILFSDRILINIHIAADAIFIAVLLAVYFAMDKRLE